MIVWFICLFTSQRHSESKKITKNKSYYRFKQANAELKPGNRVNQAGTKNILFKFYGCNDYSIGKDLAQSSGDLI